MIRTLDSARLNIKLDKRCCNSNSNRTSAYAYFTRV